MNPPAADQASSHRSLNFGGVANDPIAAQVTLAGDDDVPSRPNRSAEIAYDSIILNVNIRTALRTDRRRCPVGNLSLSRALEAIRYDGTFTTQKVLQFPKNRRIFIYPLRPSRFRSFA